MYQPELEARYLFMKEPDTVCLWRVQCNISGLCGTQGTFQISLHPFILLGLLRDAGTPTEDRWDVSEVMSICLDIDPSWWTVSRSSGTEWVDKMSLAQKGLAVTSRILVQWFLRVDPFGCLGWRVGEDGIEGQWNFSVGVFFFFLRLLV